MTLTIDLQPELEARLREEAAKSGIDAGTFVVRALEEQLQRYSRKSIPSHLSQEEAALLQKINQGLHEAIWQEYHDLIVKRRAETLTPEEHARLIALSDSVEEANAERLTHLAELARRRKTPVKTLMAQLGIKPRKV
jgi:predicted transcriptional regulator